MSNHQPDEERIFHTARKISNAEAQSEYLDQICAGDQALRERVEALLAVHEQEQSFLKSQPDNAATANYEPVTESPGQQIGRYKLLQKIGEGGFGVVYMAEQQRPVRRKVALKVIKPGMDSRAVVARFEAERQALALMDHENIARVLDGGTTESGRPYFVMDLVKGVPITEYCDQNQVPTRERLELFISVCQAVQHAHQKGIIHRDLKPSNVLVTLADGKPVVKVIDFGVAKAINQQLTEKTLFTAHGQMVGTPQYMSPEAAEMSCLDIDTRSDIYSLGVLLYELLTGSTPLEAAQLREAGYAEIQRLIKEAEPPKPSTRLSTSGDKLTAIAKHRSVSPERLSSLVKGDLDWVVMKALEKDRTRRYATPVGLADDVERYLADEPVEACPASSSYRLRKFVRRNRSLVTTVLAVAFVVILGLLGTATGLVWALRERDRAEQATEDIRDGERELRQAHEELTTRESELRQAVESYRMELVLDASELAMMNKTEEARDRLSLASLGESQQHWACLIEGQLAMNRGDFQEAISQFKQGTELNPSSVAIKSQLAMAYMVAGVNDRWHDLALQLPEIPSRTPLDHLYKAQALAWSTSHRQQNDELVGEYFRQRSSPAGRLVRARIRASRARAELDRELIDKAVFDTAVALDEMPDSPFAQLTALDAHRAAVSIYRLLGDEPKWRHYAEQGAKIANQVSPSHSEGQAVAARFYNDIDKRALATRSWDRAIESGANGYWLANYGLFLLQHDLHFSEPQRVEVLDNNNRPGSIEDVILALLQADQREGRDEARKRLLHCDEPMSGEVALYAAAVVGLLGASEKEIEAFVNRAVDSDSTATQSPQTIKAAARYLRHPTTLTQAPANTSDRKQQCLLHTISGMIKLGNRDLEGNARDSAIEDFRIAHEDLDVGWASYIARAIHARLVKDSDWPQSRLSRASR